MVKLISISPRPDTGQRVLVRQAGKGLTADVRLSTILPAIMLERWHHSSVSYSTQVQLAPQSSKLGSCARSTSRGTILLLAAPSSLSWKRPLAEAMCTPDRKYTKETKQHEPMHSCAHKAIPQKQTQQLDNTIFHARVSLIAAAVCSAA